MTTEKKERNYTRALTCSTQPKPDVTTTPNKRTFILDVCQGNDGKPFFMFNNDFLSLEPKAQVALIRHIKDRKVFCNVWVHEEATFTPFKKDGSPAPKKAKAAKKDELDADLDEDLGSEEESEDFDAL